MVERKVRGSKSSLLFLVVVWFRKAAVKGDISTVNYGGRDAAKTGLYCTHPKKGRTLVSSAGNAHLSRT
jgi:hypothetical protein